MSFIKYAFLVFLLHSTNTIFSQKKTDSAAENQEDSLTIARREKYEARLKYFKEIRWMREKDPQRFADSIAQIKDEKRYQEALVRIEKYKDSSSFDDLVELDLTGARLEEIPEWIFKAKNLEILILDHNRINSLPKRLIDIKSLRRIYWRYNDLGMSKIKIPRLEGIEKIDFTGNSISKLPKVHKLKGLKELVLENNSFTKLPTWRGRRTKNLKELDLSMNPILIDKRWYGLLDHIEILKLNKCEINFLHPSFYKMDGLTELQIQVNRLSSIPGGISALEKLTKLSFYKNDLYQLPRDFFDLEKLNVVDLYYNEFERIPSEIGNLKNLEILYLSFNKLYDVSPEISELPKLTELYIHHNRLSEIPGKLENLQHLKTLHFQDNYIPSFPMQVLKMKSLTDLDISNTDISSIPSEITSLKLKNFYWRNLDINLNDPRNEETREALLQLINQGTNVVPNISIQESTLE